MTALIFSLGYSSCSGLERTHRSLFSLASVRQLNLGWGHLKAAHTCDQGWWRGLPTYPSLSLPGGHLASSEHSGRTRRGNIPGGPGRGCIAFSIFTSEFPTSSTFYDQKHPQSPSTPKGEEKKNPHFRVSTLCPSFNSICHINNAQDLKVNMIT